MGHKFDLEKAKRGDAVKTIKGESARIICYDRKTNNYPIVALVKDEVLGEDLRSYSENGVSLDGDGNNLIMDMQEGWVNLYRDDHLRIVPGAKIFPTEESAHKEQSQYMEHVSTVKIEWVQ